MDEIGLLEHNIACQLFPLMLACTSRWPHEFPSVLFCLFVVSLFPLQLVKAMQQPPGIRPLSASSSITSMVEATTPPSAARGRTDGEPPTTTDGVYCRYTRLNQQLRSPSASVQERNVRIGRWQAHERARAQRALSLSSAVSPFPLDGYDGWLRGIVAHGTASSGNGANPTAACDSGSGTRGVIADEILIPKPPTSPCSSPILAGRQLFNQRERQQPSKDYVTRNKLQIELIEQILRGEFDVKERFDEIQAHHVAVRQRMVEQCVQRRRKLLKEEASRIEVRKERALKVENIEEFVIRVCSWMVMIRAAQSAKAITSVCCSEVRVANMERVGWALRVLGRSVPVLWRKKRRRRFLSMFAVTARVIIVVCRMRMRQARRATDTITTFLRALRTDPIAHFRAFVSRVRTATRVSRSYFKVRLAQWNLLLRQWEAMEAVLLLKSPELALTEQELRASTSLTRVESATGSIIIHGIPASLVPFRDERYLLFFLKWRKHLKQIGGAASARLLPKDLEPHRTLPAIREALLRDCFNQRNLRYRREATQFLYQYRAEKLAAVDMLKASKSFRRDDAVEEVRLRYPTVKEGTRLHQILVNFHEEYYPSEFYQVLIENHKRMVDAPLPRLPYNRLLLNEADLKRLVTKGLAESKLSRVVEHSGSVAALKLLGHGLL